MVNYFLNFKGIMLAMIVWSMRRNEEDNIIVVEMRNSLKKIIFVDLGFKLVITI